MQHSLDIHGKHTHSKGLGKEIFAILPQFHGHSLLNSLRALNKISLQVCSLEYANFPSKAPKARVQKLGVIKQF